MRRLTLLLGLVAGGTARAGEDAGSLWLPGLPGLGSGNLPPPGAYVTDQVAYYGGANAGANFDVPQQFTYDAFFNLTLSLTVTRGRLLGANYAFGAGVANVLVHLQFPGPDGNPVDEQHAGLFDLYLDPLVLGWHRGDLHWTGHLAVYAPVGDFDAENAVNVAKHHWGVDPMFGLTWLDSKRGHEVSGLLGTTFNLENRDTDYTNGIELHFDGHYAWHMPNGLAPGIAAAWLEQLTPDRGEAVPGDSGFKGRLVSFGPILSWSRRFGDRTLIEVQAKWIHDVAAKNRPRGDLVWATISFGFLGRQPRGVTTPEEATPPAPGVEG